jgi:hypothetical protein
MPARIATLALVILGLGLPVAAQPPDSITVSDTLSSNGDSFVVQVRGFASARFQPKDSYSGTWEVQCSVDGGTTYDTDDEVNLSLEGASSAAVQEVTDTVGIWTASVAGCTHLKVIATAGFAASDTTIAVGAVVSGGSSGGGASGAVTCSNCATDATHGSAASATGPQIMLNATTTYPTAVDTGDAAKAAAGLDAIQISRPHAHVGDFVKGILANTDGASTSVVAAQGAGIRFCATTIVVSNSSATNVTVDIRDGTAGSVIMTIPAAANMGGAAIPLAVPLCTTANTAFAMDGSAAATTVTVTAVGFRTAQ